MGDTAAWEVGLAPRTSGEVDNPELFSIFLCGLVTGLDKGDICFGFELWVDAFSSDFRVEARGRSCVFMAASCLCC